MDHKNMMLNEKNQSRMSTHCKIFVWNSRKDKFIPQYISLTHECYSQWLPGPRDLGEGRTEWKGHKEIF